jgi:hypothetical protein
MILPLVKSVKDDPRMSGWLPSFGLYAMSVDDIETEQVAEAFSKIVNKEEANQMAQTTAEKLLIQGRAEGKAEERSRRVETCFWRSFEEDSAKFRKPSRRQFVR